MQSQKDTKLNMGNGLSRSNLDNTWPSIYEAIKSKHDAAYKLIEEAIGLEEQEKSQEVMFNYFVYYIVFQMGTFYAGILQCALII